MAPLSSVASMILPNGVLKNRRKIAAKTEQSLKLPLIQLNVAQKNALQGLQQALPDNPHTLHFKNTTEHLRSALARQEEGEKGSEKK